MMGLAPVPSKEHAERMAIHNAGSLKRSEKIGYRVVQIEIRERPNVGG